jgi:GH15 family glucan-1,4-alpha-glucosidase
MPSSPIEDYGLISNLHSAALVCRNGSIDWFCPPRFDAPACFAALLGDEDNGRWSIAPAGEVTSTHRRYRDDTEILETTFECETGQLQLTDFMPVHSGCVLIRIVRCLRGRVAVRMLCAPRFDYGRNYPEIECGECFTFHHRGESLVLHSSMRAQCHKNASHHQVELEWEMSDGEQAWFTLRHAQASSQSESLGFDPLEAEKETASWWRDWAQRCNYYGPWRDAVVRSLITIKSLIYEPSGGMVAAPTTSLPEEPGGAANWDYRFCWLRDAALALDVLIGSHYMEEAKDWRNWLQQATKRHGGPLRTLYTIDGGLAGEEQTLPWLSGYADSRPVRIGNAASRQYQIDLRGELMDVLHVARASGMELQKGMWELQCQVLEHLAGCWDKPDAGFWEIREDYAQLTLSKVMAWVAFDRSIRDAELYNLPAPLEQWKALRDEIRTTVMDNCVDPEGGHFVERYGSKRVEAGLLLIPLVEFLPASDPRVVKTVEKIEQDLCDHGLVYRYRFDGESWYDREGAFLLCSFWLVDNYWLAGRKEEARQLFDRLVSLSNDLGLFAEEYDPRQRRMLGNFPQTLTHLGLINSARLLSAKEVMRKG